MLLELLKYIASVVLSAAVLFTPAPPETAEEPPVRSAFGGFSAITDSWISDNPFLRIFSPRSIMTRAAVSPASVITDYSADEHSITLVWEDVPDIDGYTVYINSDGEMLPAAETSGESFAVIGGLEPGTEYSFTVQPYRYLEGDVIEGYGSREFSAVTAPVREGPQIISIDSDPDANTVTLSWEKMNATGYVIYAYDLENKKWEKAAVVKDADASSFRFRLDRRAKGGRRPLGELQGREYGYRFAVKAYSTDRNGLHTYRTRVSRMHDMYYDMDDLHVFFGNQCALMDNVLKNNYTGTSKRTYDMYTTSADDWGIITSAHREAYISDASIAAIKKFSEEHFEEGWTDTEKMMYTVNWINKNVTYDIEYKAPGKGYADNIFTYRLGQCDSYNGTLAEMLTYMGYSGAYLQCMTNTVRFSQHLRAGIYSGDIYYSFEAGNDRRSAGWIWLIKEGMEVPLEGTINLTPEEEAQRRITFMEDLAIQFAEYVPEEDMDDYYSEAFGFDDDDDDLDDEFDEEYDEEYDEYDEYGDGEDQDEDDDDDEDADDEENEEEDTDEDAPPADEDAQGVTRDDIENLMFRRNSSQETDEAEEDEETEAAAADEDSADEDGDDAADDEENGGDVPADDEDGESDEKADKKADKSSDEDSSEEDDEGTPEDDTESGDEAAEEGSAPADSENNEKAPEDADTVEKEQPEALTPENSEEP